MNYLSKVSDEWIPLQNKVFTRWVSTHISKVDEKGITDVTKDLSNGVVLVELAEILTNQKAPKNWSHNPNYPVEKITNCDVALDMFVKDGVQLVGISGKDISDNNEKLILGLIWSLILHYSIGQSMNNTIHYDVDMSENRKDNNIEVNHSKIMDETIKAAEKMALLSWADKRIRDYPNIQKFVPYDLVICALLDSYFPDKIQYNNLNPENHQENLKIANSVMKDLKIPIFVYPEDLSKCDNKVDMKILLTQLSAAKVVLDNTITSSNSHTYDDNQCKDECSSKDVKPNIELAKIEKIEEERLERIQNAEMNEKTQKVEEHKLENNQKVEAHILENYQKVDGHKMENHQKVVEKKNESEKVNSSPKVQSFPSAKLIVESYPETKKSIVVKQSHGNTNNDKKTINIGIGIKKNQTIKNVQQVGETKIVNGRRVKTIRVGIKIKAKNAGSLNLANYPKIAVVPLPGKEYRHIQIKNIRVTAKHNGKVVSCNNGKSPVNITTN